MIESDVPVNPYPGLRPFEPDEDYLFFGREKQIDELLRRLRRHRFLAIVGTSGTGKSSLVRSGLIPALHSGYMVVAGSSWRIATFRPGGNPIANLAAALDAPEVLGRTGELAGTNRVLLEATLLRGTLGLVEAVRQARIPAHDNVLVVVDQFEELFRFRNNRQVENARQEALTFVSLLLEAAQQKAIPIFVVITMRSDFIGECMAYSGLPEAINTGQYLVPRMTRDELRSAITGPAAVGGGEISARLVLRLLNDLGEDQDQLPLLQHALMRTWDHWRTHRPANQATDIPDYEAIGTIRNALSLHAEEAHQESISLGWGEISERTFKALTDTYSDHRGVRRPTAVRELAAICKAPEQEVIETLEVFRRPGRSFLMPPASVPLDSSSIIDLSHESLMRCWTRLNKWADEERASAGIYVRLTQAAAWFREGTAALWRNPELELGLRWRDQCRPSQAWAERYDSNFPRAIEFLDRSKQERDRIEAERELQRKRQLHRAWSAAGVLGAMLVIVGLLAYTTQREKNRAEENLTLARNAVNVIVSSASRAQAHEAADVPEVEELRRELLRKVESFYVIFTRQKPENAELRREAASAHSRLADIHRLLNQHEDAMREYRGAIGEFQSLASDHPNKPEYREDLAYAFNWLGETLRTWLENPNDHSPHSRAEAEDAYQRAISLQQDLHRQSPENAGYQQQLARTYYNHGILRYDGGDLKTCESDFREAIRLLEPLVAQKKEAARAENDGVPPSQDLARAYNALATLTRDQEQPFQARTLYERAIKIGEVLVKQKDDREYKVELAMFYNNLAFLLWDENELETGKQRNSQALDLIDELATPTPTVEEQRAKAFLLRALIGQSKHPDYPNLAGQYLNAARKGLQSGSLADAADALTSMSLLAPLLAEPARTSLIMAHDDLERELTRKKANRK